MMGNKLQVIGNKKYKQPPAPANGCLYFLFLKTYYL
jgi:hypothetical protein